MHGGVSSPGGAHPPSPTRRSIEMPIVKRYTESRTRPQAIENFQKAMYMSRSWFVEARTNMTTAENGTVFPWTEADLDLVEMTLKDNESWMKEQMEKQEAVLEDPTADPVLLTADLISRGKRIQSLVSGRRGSGAKELLRAAR